MEGEDLKKKKERKKEKGREGVRKKEFKKSRVIDKWGKGREGNRKEIKIYFSEAVIALQSRKESQKAGSKSIVLY